MLLSALRVQPSQAVPAVVPYRLHQSARLQSTHRHRIEDVPHLPHSFIINAGGPAVEGFFSDTLTSSWVVGDTSSFDASSTATLPPDLDISPLYETQRFSVISSIWGYNLPLSSSGVYKCTAYFAEINPQYMAPAARVFHLLFASTKSEERFEYIDPYANASNSVNKVFTVTARNLLVTGVLSVRLIPVIAEPAISGLSCERTGDLPNSLPPQLDTVPPDVPEPPVDFANMPSFAINCAPTSEVPGFYSDRVGTLNGITSVSSPSSSSPPAPIDIFDETNIAALYSYRHGVNSSSFSYEFLAAPSSRYNCSFYFRETERQFMRPGARVFHIRVNDKKIENIDVFGDVDSSSVCVKSINLINVRGILNVRFIRVSGDPFISAFACVKVDEIIGPTTYPSSNPTLFPSDEDDESDDGIDESQSPFESPDETPQESVSDFPSESPTLTSTDTPVPSSIPMLSASMSPVPSVSLVSQVSNSPGGGDGLVSRTPKPSQTVTTTSTSEATSDSSDSSLIANPDPTLSDGEGRVISTFKLRVTISDGSQMFTNALKEALKEISKRASSEANDWAIVAINRTGQSRRTLLSDAGWLQNSARTIRQGGKSNVSYDVDAQAAYREGDEESGTSEFKDFVSSGDATNEMRKEGYDSVDIKLRNGQASGAAVGSTSVIVIVVVAAAMVALAGVAVIAYMASNNRSNRAQQGDFDAPPPLTESDVSSVLERSETAGSLEYLDDDSTYTAATSRAGDHMDPVSFVKDVFGRGTVDVNDRGVHGSASISM